MSHEVCTTTNDDDRWDCHSSSRLMSHESFTLWRITFVIRYQNPVLAMTPHSHPQRPNCLHETSSWTTSTTQALCRATAPYRLGHVRKGCFSLVNSSLPLDNRDNHLKEEITDDSSEFLIEFRTLRVDDGQNWKICFCSFLSFHPARLLRGDAIQAAVFDCPFICANLILMYTDVMMCFQYHPHSGWICPQFRALLWSKRYHPLHCPL